MAWNNKWKVIKLQEGIKTVIDYRGKTPPKSPSGIPLISAANIKGGKLNFSTKNFISPEDYDTWATRGFTAPGDILITTEAPVGEVALYPNNGQTYLISRRVIALRTKESILDNRFLLYNLQYSATLSKLLINSRGSTVPRVLKPDILNLELNLPPLPTQRRIAAILAAFDDKIELNRRMNRTLEAMAQALFRELCTVPEGEALPAGWREVNIGQLFDFVIGGDWGKEEFQEDHPVQTAVIRGTDFSEIQKGNYSSPPSRFVKESKFKKRKLQHGDILLEISGGSKDQPTGRSLLITDKIIENLGGNVIHASFCRLIRPLNKAVGYFLWLYLQMLYDEGGTWEYQNQSTGISNFQFSFFSEKEKLIFPKDLAELEEFEKLVEPIVHKIDNNNTEIKELVSLRDVLLPKLMSGELEVGDISKVL